MAKPIRAALRWSIRQESRFLAIEYTIDNAESHDIGVFNWIRGGRPDGTIVFEPSVAYVELEEENLIVRKMALPIPQGLQMAAYVPPGASRVGAGGRFGERIVLECPVRVLQPFNAALAGMENAGQVVADRPTRATMLSLQIGVFPIDDTCGLLAEHPAFPQVLTATTPGPAVERQWALTETRPLAHPIDVLNYRSVP